MKKNKQRGFAMFLLIVVTACLLIGGGVYAYKQKEDLNASVAGKTASSSEVSIVTNKTEPAVKSEIKVEVKTDVAQKISTLSYSGASYGFSYPSDWDIRDVNRVLGLTMVFPKSKSDQVMNNTISTTDKINISLVENKYIDLTGATKVTLNGQIWYVKIYKGPFDGGGENESVSYLKEYNTTKYVDINSGMSNKATVEFIATSFTQG